VSSVRTEGFRTRIRKLTEVSRSITYAASLDEVFQLTVDRAAELLGADRSLLLVVDNDGLLALRSLHGIDIALAQDFREPLSEMLIQRLALRLDAQPESFLGVPLVVAGTVTGILVVIRPASAIGADDDEWLLSALADQASVALEKTRLDELGEFREQLVGIVGHDLRNPLNTILMGAHILLLCEGLGQKETGLVRKIVSNATQATRLIDQLLDLTRSRLGGGIPIDPTRYDLNDVCQQVIDEAQLTHPERPLRVDVRGDVTVVWDRDRMYQLLANLVGNAIHHGEPLSPIELRIDGGETEVAIDVANRGEPIPQAALPFIFDAFRKGRTAHPSRTQGLGLGLFIVREIARSHGGSIAVTSSASDGTTFRVRLPRGCPVSQHSRHATDEDN
jgi:sigma-B regulation protein RsbU (phosphoserine phosphatase)